MLWKLLHIFLHCHRLGKPWVEDILILQDPEQIQLCRSSLRHMLCLPWILAVSPPPHRCMSKIVWRYLSHITDPVSSISHHYCPCWFVIKWSIEGISGCSKTSKSIVSWPCQPLRVDIILPGEKTTERTHKIEAYFFFLKSKAINMQK